MLLFIHIILTFLSLIRFFLFKSKNRTFTEIFPMDFGIEVKLGFKYFQYKNIARLQYHTCLVGKIKLDMAKRKIIKNSHYEKIGIASRKRNRSEVMLPNDVLTCTIVPIMTVPVSQCQHSFPDLKLVSKLHEICSSGISNQKAIAMKCKIR
jgi:hypothetical protein